MVLEIYQIVAVLFCLVMIYFTFLFYKRKNYSLVSLSTWIVVWLAAIVLVAFPGLLSPLTTRLAFGRIFDLYVAMAVMFFALVTFFNHVRVSKYERKVEELVREVAIHEVHTRAKKKR